MLNNIQGPGRTIRCECGAETRLFPMSLRLPGLSPTEEEGWEFKKEKWSCPKCQDLDKNEEEK